MDIDLSSTSTAGVKMYLDSGTQTAPDKRVDLLQKKVKNLKQKVKRRDVKISSMKDIFKKISKRDLSNDNLDTVLKKHFEGKKSFL